MTLNRVIAIAAGILLGAIFVVWLINDYFATPKVHP